MGISDDDSLLGMIVIFTASYPVEPPLVSVRSSVLSPEDAAAFTAFLQSVTEGFVGQAMIVDVMKEGMDWLKDNNINVEPGKEGGQKEKKKGNATKTVLNYT